MLLSASVSCPGSHQVALDHGYSCCDSMVKALSSTPEQPEKVEISDPVGECGGSRVPCPGLPHDKCKAVEKGVCRPTCTTRQHFIALFVHSVFTVRSPNTTTMYCLTTNKTKYVLLSATVILNYIDGEPISHNLSN